MATTLQTPARGPADRPARTIPPLAGGDRLTAAEYLRRYTAMPELKKAELIEGRVYVGSPVSAVGHGEPHSDIVGWLVLYKASTPGIAVGDNATVRLDDDNIPQPDAYLRIEADRGGQSQIGDDGYVHRAPELVVELTATSARYDLHEKLTTYRKHGVQEYIVWRTFDNALDYFALENGEYVGKPANADGVIRSRIFPGLWLEPAALIRRDIATVLKVVQQGIASAEHEAFAARLVK